MSWEPDQFHDGGWGQLDFDQSSLYDIAELVPDDIVTTTSIGTTTDTDSPSSYPRSVDSHHGESTWSSASSTTSTSSTVSNLSTLEVSMLSTLDKISIINPNISSITNTAGDDATSLGALQGSIKTDNGYIIATREHLLVKMREIISNIAEFCYITNSEAETLLRFFLWNTQQLQHSWISSKYDTRAKSGVWRHCDHACYQPGLGCTTTLLRSPYTPLPDPSWDAFLSYLNDVFIIPHSWLQLSHQQHHHPSTPSMVSVQQDQRHHLHHHHHHNHESNRAIGSKSSQDPPPTPILGGGGSRTPTLDGSHPVHAFALPESATDSSSLSMTEDNAGKHHHLGYHTATLTPEASYHLPLVEYQGTTSGRTALSSSPSTLSSSSSSSPWTNPDHVIHGNMQTIQLLKAYLTYLAKDFHYQKPNSNSYQHQINKDQIWLSSHPAAVCTHGSYGYDVYSSLYQQILNGDVNALNNYTVPFNTTNIHITPLYSPLEYFCAVIYVIHHVLSTHSQSPSTTRGGFDQDTQHKQPQSSHITSPYAFLLSTMLLSHYDHQFETLLQSPPPQPESDPDFESSAIIIPTLETTTSTTDGPSPPNTMEGDAEDLAASGGTDGQHDKQRDPMYDLITYDEFGLPIDPYDVDESDLTQLPYDCILLPHHALGTTQFYMKTDEFMLISSLLQYGDDIILSKSLPCSHITHPSTSQPHQQRDSFIDPSQLNIPGHELYQVYCQALTESIPPSLTEKILQTVTSSFSYTRYQQFLTMPQCTFLASQVNTRDRIYQETSSQTRSSSPSTDSQMLDDHDHDYSHHHHNPSQTLSQSILPFLFNPTIYVRCNTAFCDIVPIHRASSLGCGHWFCNACWLGHLSNELDTKGRNAAMIECMGNDHFTYCRETALDPDHHKHTQGASSTHGQGKQSSRGNGKGRGMKKDDDRYTITAPSTISHGTTTLALGGLHDTMHDKSILGKSYHQNDHDHDMTEYTQTGSGSSSSSCAINPMVLETITIRRKRLQHYMDTCSHDNNDDMQIGQDTTLSSQLDTTPIAIQIATQGHRHPNARVEKCNTLVPLSFLLERINTTNTSTFTAAPLPQLSSSASPSPKASLESHHNDMNNQEPLTTPTSSHTGHILPHSDLYVGVHPSRLPVTGGDPPSNPSQQQQHHGAGDDQYAATDSGNPYIHGGSGSGSGSGGNSESGFTNLSNSTESCSQPDHYGGLVEADVVFVEAIDSDEGDLILSQAESQTPSIDDYDSLNSHHSYSTHMARQRSTSPRRYHHIAAASRCDSDLKLSTTTTTTTTTATAAISSSSLSSMERTTTNDSLASTTVSITSISTINHHPPLTSIPSLDPPRLLLQPTVLSQQASSTFVPKQTSHEQYNRLLWWILDGYISGSSHMQWCANPNCNSQHLSSNTSNPVNNNAKYKWFQPISSREQLEAMASPMDYVTISRLRNINQKNPYLHRVPHHRSNTSSISDNDTIQEGFHSPCIVISTPLATSTSVTCQCGFHQCFRCQRPFHLPAPCDLVAKWESLQQTEQSNELWMLAKTKPCPNCKAPIEKDRACNHMTCTCRHQFCWLCLKSWTTHTSGQYGCSAYADQEKTGKYHDVEKTVVANAARLTKFEYYGSRYQQHHDAIAFTLRLAHNLHTSLQNASNFILYYIIKTANTKESLSSSATTSRGKKTKNAHHSLTPFLHQLPPLKISHQKYLNYQLSKDYLLRAMKNKTQQQQMIDTETLFRKADITSYNNGLTSSKLNMYNLNRLDIIIAYNLQYNYTFSPYECTVPRSDAFGSAAHSPPPPPACMDADYYQSSSINIQVDPVTDIVAIDLAIKENIENDYPLDMTSRFDFLFTALDVLVEARTLLKWSYVVAFFMRTFEPALDQSTIDEWTPSATQTTTAAAAAVGIGITGGDVILHDGGSTHNPNEYNPLVNLSQPPPQQQQQQQHTSEKRTRSRKQMFELQLDILVNLTEHLTRYLEYLGQDIVRVMKWKKDIIKLIPPIQQLIKFIIGQVECGAFDDSLLYQADDEFSIDQWKCGCGKEHTIRTSFCYSCRECRKHREPDCRICTIG